MQMSTELDFDDHRHVRDLDLKIAVVGLGYIGLPTAVMFASHGHEVIGVDVLPEVVETLARGDIHIEEPGVAPVLKSVVESGSFRPQLLPEKADVFILSVPTPSNDDHSPNLGFVTKAAESIVPYLEPGNLVILESTSPPGTTIGLIPTLERSGLKVGVDIYLAHSPERVLPGRILIELVENDRVIGGYTLESAQKAADLYHSFVQGRILQTDATTAEMAKLMENTFRDVNIALANEFSRIAERVGIDVNEAIRLANHHPRVNILNPGPGVGGHCIAVDPWFIVDSAPEESTLIRTARVVNDAQPGYVADIVTRIVSGIENPTVAVLGLAYKPDVDDIRESPSVEVVKHLSRLGYRLRLHDSHTRSEVAGMPVYGELSQAVSGADAMIILTDHREYHRLEPDDESLSGIVHRILIDTRNCVNPNLWRDAGYAVHRLGVGAPFMVTEGPDLD